MPGPIRIKPAMRWVHRWIGLTLGFVLALICLSGTLLFFQPQLFHWAHSSLIPSNLPQQRGSMDAWVRNARSAVPNLHGPIAVWGPHTDHNVSDAGMLVFTGLPPGGLGHTGLAAVLVSPASGQVLGVIDVDRSPAYAPLFVHGALGSGNFGKVLVGIVAVGTLLMLPIGLYLWWPPRARLLQKLSPRPWRTTLAYAGRLHDVTGAWTVLLLILLSATGLYIVQPEWVEPALRQLPGPPATAGHRSAAGCDGPIGFDRAIERAQALVPAATWSSMHPEGDEWEIVFRPRVSAARATETHVSADLECGIVEIETTPSNRSARETAELWMESLHDGSAFGLGGRLLVTAMGIMPLLLLWTGIRMWLKKRTHRRK